MYAYTFALFGRFNARCNDSELTELERGKAQDVLCYLLLNRRQTHYREDLAARFWPEATTAQSRKYLRQAIWQIQKALDAAAEGGPKLIRVQPNWIRVDPDVTLWIDIEAFEATFERVKDVPATALDHDQAEAVKQAVDLYSGPLLQGWYPDWCTLERERLEGMYMQLLDKLMDRCEAAREYDEGIGYGARVLRRERARETTHRRLIRLFYLAGDRTAALNQYHRCAVILHEELGVQPSAGTMELLEQIRADRLDYIVSTPDLTSSLYQTLDHLHQIKSALSSLHAAVEHEITQLERTTRPRHGLLADGTDVQATQLDRAS